METPLEKQKPEIKVIILEGGGIRGLSYIGVAKALETRGLLKDIEIFISSSAGSIFAGLLACGADTKFLEDNVKKTNFNYFCDGLGWYIGEAYRFSWKMGMYNGDYFLNWYRDLLKNLTGNKDITLKEIYDKYGKQIILTATNLNERKTYYFNKDNYPDLSLAQAVRMSMSIPLFFVPVYYQNSYWIDGGYLDNYPFDYCDTFFPRKLAIGFKLMGDAPEKYTISGWSSLMTNLIECSVAKIEKLLTKEIDDDRTVLIDTFDISTVQFDISESDIDRLIESGYSDTMANIDRIIC